MAQYIFLFLSQGTVPYPRGVRTGFDYLLFSFFFGEKSV
jgi:hypothetical protein